MLFKDYVDLLDETCPYESNVPAISLRFREIISPFVGGDKAKAALSASGINPKIQKDEVRGSISVTWTTVYYYQRSRPFYQVQPWVLILISLKHHSSHRKC
ncbi:hypothetical protein CT0861_07969 [Colletotrichum tofieldiae]|uniref:Uncharacterized protein n=1 Tax=Colletotrichum tofieldiae TaxID=708197 RepID=A0A166VLS5_9PEZI|nr:hypothetical protein CT0861_07969 [Colletotrichum tofieldiae]